MVIGLGSMGRRRIRLMKKFDNSIIVVGVDTNPERCKAVSEEYGIETASCIKEAIEKSGCEFAFVCTSPLSHADVIGECLKNLLHVFSEINLVSDKYESNIKLASEVGKELFLSSTFLYRKEINHIKSIVEETAKKCVYRYHCGQYLPDWHPWEDYRNFFVSNKRSNACRELFAIELPWIIDAFGQVRKVSVSHGNASDLQIDFPDFFNVIVEHENGTSGVITIDIVARKAIRDLEVYNEDIYVKWNGTPDGLFKYNILTKEFENIKTYEQVDKLSEYSENIIEDAYLGEIINFFESVEGAGTPRYSFEKDLKTLRIIDQIEQGI